MGIIRIDNRLAIQDFIESFWKRNHSLAKSTALLDFQHYNANDGLYNYYCAEERKCIWGILGYIPTSQFDKTLFDEKDVWGAMWKIREDCPIHGMGLELMDCLLEGYNSFGAIGISNIARKIYRLYGMKIDVLKQYYIANPSITQFVICKGLINKRISACSNKEWSLKVLYSLSNIKDISCSYRPRKTITYLKNRYEFHPIYKYFFWGIYKGDNIVSLWVLRRISIGNNSVFRIVDMLGDIEDIPNIAHLIQSELQNECVEYVDCLNYGIQSSDFETIGFIQHNLDSQNAIVPNYFEPFEQRNVKIELAYKSDYKYVAFKGDSDQDRPNLL